MRGLAQQLARLGERLGRQEFEEQRQEVRQLVRRDRAGRPSRTAPCRSTIAWPRSRLSPWTCSNRCSDSERRAVEQQARSAPAGRRDRRSRSRSISRSSARAIAGGSSASRSISTPRISGAAALQLRGRIGQQRRQRLERRVITRPPSGSWPRLRRAEQVGLACRRRSSRCRR